LRHTGGNCEFAEGDVQLVANRNLPLNHLAIYAVPLTRSTARQSRARAESCACSTRLALRCSNATTSPQRTSVGCVPPTSYRTNDG
jgi:hypothetical protein